MMAVKTKEFCDRIGIEFFCSVFYPEAVDFLESLGVNKYKIATRTMLGRDPYSKQTIQAVLNTDKKIIVSNGDLPNSYRLYCIPDYPANPGDISWKEILKYDGFSDHTVGITEAVKYANLKPNGIIEKHVKLVNTNSPDSPFSITTQELATLITLSTS